MLLIRALLLTIILLATPGCIHLKQVITINEDRTGSFEIYAAIPTTTANALIRGAKAPYAETYGWIFDVEKGSAHFRELPGFKLLNYRVFELDNRLYVRIQGDIVDANRLLVHPAAGGFTWKSDANSTTLTAPLPAAATADRAAWLQLAEGMRLQLEVNVPGKISTTNGNLVKPQSVVWSFAAEDLLPGPNNLTELTVTWP